MPKKFIIKLIFVTTVFLGGLLLFFWWRPLQQLESAKDLLKKSSYRLDDSTQVLTPPTKGYYKAMDMLSDLQSNLFVGTQASNLLNINISTGINAFVDNYASKIYTLREKGLDKIRAHFDLLKLNNTSQSQDWFYEQQKHYADMLKANRQPLDSLAMATLNPIVEDLQFEELCTQWSTFLKYTLTMEDSTLTKLCACNPILLSDQDVRTKNFHIFKSN